MALNSDQISRVLSAILHRSHYFGAVSFQDLPLTVKKYPFCVVINSAPKNEFYGHWVCIFAENKYDGVYFDSFGIAPWGRIYDFITGNITSAIFNRRLLQSFQSEVCGFYCILVLKNLDAGMGLAEILSQFSDDVIENDTKVTLKVRRLISALEV